MKGSSRGKTASLILESAEVTRRRAEGTFVEVQRLIHESDGAITPETVLQALQLRESINRMLSHLPDRQQQVVRMTFGLDDGNEMSVEEIAHELSQHEGKHINSHRVRLMLRVALHRFTKQYAADLLFDNGWENPLLNQTLFAATPYTH
jgi:DNA-directed RNA polymerase sigma subunit (sigma70/sigma32)